MYRYMIATLLFVTAGEARYCWKIGNSDMRYFCESKFESKRHCWKIQNADRRAYCEAVAEGKKSCWKIRENDLRQLCFAQRGD